MIAIERGTVKPATLRLAKAGMWKNMACISVHRLAQIALSRPQRLVWLGHHQSCQHLSFIVGIVTSKFWGVQYFTALRFWKFAQIPNRSMDHRLPVEWHLMHFDDAGADLLALLV
jgi:hypothetical protein